MPGIKLCNLTKRAIEVFDFIKENGPVTPKQIARFTNMPSRTVFFAISNLIDEDLVTKAPDLKDMRNVSYSVNPTRVAELRGIVSHLSLSLPLQVDDEVKEILDISDNREDDLSSYLTV